MGQSSEEACSRPGGRRFVSILGQQGSRCVWTKGWRGDDQRRKNAGRSCSSLLSELRIHCRALSKEVADVNWCGHPGDVVTLVMWSEWSFWLLGWKLKLKCWGRGRETPGGFSLLPSGSVWWWLRLGCSGEVKRKGWILNMFWRGNRIFWQIECGRLKKIKKELKMVFEPRAWKDRSGHSWDGQDVTRRGQRKRSGV